MQIRNIHSSWSSISGIKNRMFLLLGSIELRNVSIVDHSSIEGPLEIEIGGQLTIVPETVIDSISDYSRKKYI